MLKRIILCFVLSFVLNLPVGGVFLEATEFKKVELRKFKKSEKKIIEEELKKPTVDINAIFGGRDPFASLEAAADDSNTKQTKLTEHVKIFCNAKIETFKEKAGDKKLEKTRFKKSSLNKILAKFFIKNWLDGYIKQSMIRNKKAIKQRIENKIDSYVENEDIGKSYKLVLEAQFEYLFLHRHYKIVDELISLESRIIDILSKEMTFKKTDIKKIVDQEEYEEKKISGKLYESIHKLDRLLEDTSGALETKEYRIYENRVKEYFDSAVSYPKKKWDDFAQEVDELEAKLKKQIIRKLTSLENGSLNPFLEAVIRTLCDAKEDSKYKRKPGGMGLSILNLIKKVETDKELKSKELLSRQVEIIKHERSLHEELENKKSVAKSLIKNLRNKDKERDIPDDIQNSKASVFQVFIQAKFVNDYVIPVLKIIDELLDKNIKELNEAFNAIDKTIKKGDIDANSKETGDGYLGQFNLIMHTLVIKLENAAEKMKTKIEEIPGDEYETTKKQLAEEHKTDDIELLKLLERDEKEIAAKKRDLEDQKVRQKEQQQKDFEKAREARIQSEKEFDENNKDQAEAQKALMKLVMDGEWDEVKKALRNDLMYGHLSDLSSQTGILPIAAKLKAPLDIIEQLIAKKAPITSSHPKTGMTALHWLTKNKWYQETKEKQVKIIELLLSKNAKITKKASLEKDFHAEKNPYSGKTPFAFALENFSLSTNKNLLKMLAPSNKIKADAVLTFLTNPNKNIELAKKVLEIFPETNLSSKKAILHNAINIVSEDDILFIEKLIKKKADIDAMVKVTQTKTNKRTGEETPLTVWHTPLHVASEEKKAKIAALLVKKGADLTARSKGAGNTVLHNAAINNSHEVIKAIFEAVADYESTRTTEEKRAFKKDGSAAVETENNAGKTAFILAIQSRSRKAISELASLEKRVKTLSELTKDPSKYALALAKKLLIFGNIENLEKTKHLLTDAAARKADKMFINRLISKKVNINEKTEIDENTALHIAVRNLDLGLVKLLLENGADKELENEKEETPKMMAGNIMRNSPRDDEKKAKLREIIKAIDSESMTSIEKI